MDFYIWSKTNIFLRISLRNVSTSISLNDTKRPTLAGQPPVICAIISVRRLILLHDFVWLEHGGELVDERLELLDVF